MNWYKKSQQVNVSVLGADAYGELTLEVNGEIKKYQLPYTAIGSYSDIAMMIKKKQIKKLNKYIEWLEQYSQEVKSMDIGVGSVATVRHKY